MEKKKALIILVLIIIISSALIYFYSALKPVEIKTIDMYLTVGNYTGFNVNTSALFFGTIIPSSHVKRTINITNIDKNTHKIYIKATGELSKYTSVSETRFILNENESKEVEVRVDIPVDTEHGEYTGYLKIIFR